MAECRLYDPFRVWGSVTALSWLARIYPLFLIGSFEIGTPFARMLAMAHFLDLRELGFASALAATYGTVEQVTDIAIYRFVFSAKHEEYQETLASAHALSVARGAIVGMVAFAVAPLVAWCFSLTSDWLSFGVLGGITFIRSFEHLGPRVAERDYKYGAQFHVVLASNGLALLSVLTAAFLERNHNAIVISLLGQVVGLVIASHAFADTPYRIMFRSRQFVRAFHYGYPLMINGMGLAVTGQGDRFLVGSMLGLPTLGVYSIALLAAIIPLSMVFRILGTVNLGRFHNAPVGGGALVKRMTFSAQLSPIIATVYAIGVVSLMNIVVPAVFGRKFSVSNSVIAFLAFVAFFRMMRIEPFTSILLHQGRTKALSVANLSTAAGLVFATFFISFQRSMDSALAGRMLGEVVGLIVVTFLTRTTLGSALGSLYSTASLGLILVGSECFAAYLFPIGLEIRATLMALGCFMLISMILALSTIGGFSTHLAVSNINRLFKKLSNLI